MKTLPFVSLVAVGLITSCASSELQFPADLQPVDSNRVSITIRESVWDGKQQTSMGPFPTVVSRIELVIGDQDSVIFPTNTFSDLGDLHEQAASFSYSSKDAIHVLSIPGGDGGESYRVHFGISGRRVIWRRVGWTCPDKQGNLLKTCFRDTEYNKQNKSEMATPSKPSD